MSLPFSAVPAVQGLYDPRFESDSCGVAFVADLQGRAGHHIIERALMQFDGRIALDDLRGLLEGTGLEDSSGSGDNTTVH